MDIPIRKIVVPDRIREDLGDLDGLTESMRTCGLLNPISVTRDLKLLAGRRRLECARRLGWECIEVHLLDDADAVRRTEIEIQENLHRKDFTPDELLRGLQRLERLRRPAIHRRVGRSLRAMAGKLCFWRRVRKPGPMHSPPPENRPPVPAAHA